MKTINNKPIVSVIMPVLNARKYLVKSVNSILNQTEDNFEFLIIDDGSVDGSWEILRKFAKKDRRIKLFRNITNKGLVRSLNTLIPKTKGVFVARMDADDISVPNRLSKQIKFLNANPEIVACGGQEEIIDTRGRTIAEKYFPIESQTCRNMIMNVMVIQPPLLMARGNVMRKLRYDNHIFKNDDISIHFKLLQYGEFGNVDEVIFKYRRVPESLTHKHPKKVYFLALAVRLNAIFKYGFRPSGVNLLMAIPETILVGILPEQKIIEIFEMLRFTYASARQAFERGMTIPKLATAKLAAALLLLR